MTERQTRRALAFVLLTVFLDTVAVGLSMPVMPALVMQLSGGGMAEAARAAGWLLFCFALLQCVAMPILGSLSDRYGRRPVLLLSLGAFGIDYLLIGWAPSLGWLFAGRMLAGLFSATYATASACIADLSKPDERARRFGLLASAWGLGLFAGPALGGWIGALDIRLPFYIAGGLAIATSLAGLLLLPESLAPANRRELVLRRANPLAALARVRAYPKMTGLLGALLCFQVAYQTTPCVWPYFTIEQFGWSAQELGWSFALAGAAIALFQAFGVGPLVRRLGERRAVLFGFAVVTATFLGFALAGAGWVLYVLLLPYAAGTIGMVALRSVMSNAVLSDAQGELHGVIGSVVSLATVITPLLMPALFAAFTAPGAPLYLPGAPYLLAAALAALSLGACTFLLRPYGAAAPARPAQVHP